MENFKQACEAFALSYWDVVDWKDFICNGRNCFFVSRVALVSPFRQRDGDFSYSFLSCVFPPLQRKLLELQHVA